MPIDADRCRLQTFMRVFQKKIFVHERSAVKYSFSTESCTECFILNDIVHPKSNHTLFFQVARGKEI